MSLTNERELVEQAQAGDSAARNAVVMSMWPFICMHAGKISKWKGTDADDLAQVAVAKVIAKFHKFDASCGNKAMTYLGVVAIRAMREYADTDNVIRLPHFSGAEVDREAFKERHGKVRRVLSVHGDDSGEFSWMGDGKAVDPSEGAGRAEAIRRAKYLMRFLPAIELDLVRLRMRGYTLKQAGDVLGFTRERARQIEARAKVRMYKVGRKGARV